MTTLSVDNLVDEYIALGNQGKVLEAYMSLHTSTVDMIDKVYDRTGATSVVELGFGAGHSSLLWLQHDGQVRFTSIDDDRYGYSRENMHVIRGIFGGRFQGVIADIKDYTQEIENIHDLWIFDAGSNHRSIAQYFQKADDNGAEYILVMRTDEESIHHVVKQFEQDILSAFEPIERFTYRVTAFAKDGSLVEDKSWATLLKRV